MVVCTQNIISHSGPKFLTEDDPTTMMICHYLHRSNLPISAEIVRKELLNISKTIFAKDGFEAKIEGQLTGTYSTLPKVTRHIDLCEDHHIYHGSCQIMLSSNVRFPSKRSYCLFRESSNNNPMLYATQSEAIDLNGAKLFYIVVSRKEDNEMKLFVKVFIMPEANTVIDSRIEIQVRSGGCTCLMVPRS